MRPEVIAELEHVRSKDPDRLLHPAALVKAASKPTSPLHSWFEWDDDAAAEAYRLEQARHLIRVCVATISDDTEPIRAFVHLLSDERGYRDTGAVLENTDLRAELLEQALREAERYRAKYQHLEELAAIFAAIETTRKRQLPSKSIAKMEAAV